MVGIHRIGCIRVLAIIGFKGKSGLADARLVDEVCREAFAQENILEPLAAVRRRFPRAFRLCAAMFKNQRIFFRMHWFLIEGIGMVAISRLARRLQKRLARERAALFLRVAAHGKAPLLCYDERRILLGLQLRGDFCRCSRVRRCGVSLRRESQKTERQGQSREQFFQILSFHDDNPFSLTITYNIQRMMEISLDKTVTRPGR